MLEHGGRLRAAAARHGIPLSRWLDLSTGINPHGYVPPPVPAEAWVRLPEDDDGLEEAAAAYYGTSEVLPVCGSQTAIQTLPRLRARSNVCIVSPAYAEHAHAWRMAGHTVTHAAPDEVARHVGNADVLVVVNPNNPTGGMVAPEQLRDWHRQLAARDGWLVADEAFMDATPGNSLAQASMPQGLIVLRSLGKFFGLAGARVGFVLAHAALRAGLRELLGPWTVAGPARIVAGAALQDQGWQEAARARLAQDSARLAETLRGNGLAPAGGCGLFQWVKTQHAETLHGNLAWRGILTRYFSDTSSVRFGLPGREADWQRLGAALRQECMA